MQDLLLQLRRIYILFWIISLGIGIIFIKVSFVSLDKEINVSLESISVLFTMFGIWITYNFFHRRLKMLHSLSDEKDIYASYKKLFLFCIALLLIIIVCDMMVYCFTHTYSALFCAAMVWIVAIISYPSKYKVETDLHKNNKTE